MGDMDMDEDVGDIGELIAKRRKLPDFFYHTKFADVLDNSVFDETGKWLKKDKPPERKSGENPEESLIPKVVPRKVPELVAEIDPATDRAATESLTQSVQL